MTLPASFTQVEGWREAFAEAADTLSETRAGSLFAFSEEVCGVSTRPLSLRTWTILHILRNPLVCGGTLTTAHALHALWIMREGWQWVGEDTRLARVLRKARGAYVLHLAGYDEQRVCDEVCAHVDSAFLDSPGRFAKSSEPTPANPVHHPRASLEIQLTGEVMAAFPSFRFDELRNMPLAQFWQWLHRARKLRDPEYRNDQLTDQVNRDYLKKLNALRRADRAFKDQATK